MNLNETVKKLERVFTLHMEYEYPQIDTYTRGALAYELALVATGFNGDI